MGMKKILCSLFIATLLWFVMFSQWTAPYLNFWCAMTCSALLLITLSIAWGGKNKFAFNLTEVLFGLLIAVVLWCVFWVGDKTSQWLFDFARPQVDLIYGMKTGQNSTLISLALLCIIGPAEELFWRGYIQRSLVQKYTPNIAFLLTLAAYTLVHLPSMNFMLIMAAMVCGVAWGGLYRLFPQHFGAILLSHALWDAAAFVWFPI